MLNRVKKDDSVAVLSGRDKGKSGAVIAINPKKETVTVKGIGIVTRHVKAKRRGEQGKIVKEEKPVLLCKVMPVCPSCKKVCRVGIKVLENGKKSRACHRCKEIF